MIVYISFFQIEPTGERQNSSAGKEQAHLAFDWTGAKNNLEKNRVGIPTWPTGVEKMKQEAQFEGADLCWADFDPVYLSW